MWGDREPFKADLREVHIHSSGVLNFRLNSFTLTFNEQILCSCFVDVDFADWSKCTEFAQLHRCLVWLLNSFQAITSSPPSSNGIRWSLFSPVMSLRLINFFGFLPLLPLLFFFFFKKRTLCHIVWPSLIIERLSCSCHAKAMTLKNLSAAIYIKMTCLEGNKQINIHNARVEYIHRKQVS